MLRNRETIFFQETRFLNFKTRFLKVIWVPKTVRTSCFPGQKVIFWAKTEENPHSNSKNSIKIAKTRFGKAETRFEKAKTRFESPKTRFESPKTRFSGILLEWTWVRTCSKKTLDRIRKITPGVVLTYSSHMRQKLKFVRHTPNLTCLRSRRCRNFTLVPLFWDYVCNQLRA